MMKKCILISLVCIITIFSAVSNSYSMLVAGIHSDSLLVYDYWQRGDSLEHKMILVNIRNVPITVQIYEAIDKVVKERMGSSIRISEKLETGKLPSTITLKERDYAIIDYPQIKDKGSGKLLEFFENGEDAGILGYDTTSPPFDISKNVIVSNTTWSGCHNEDIWYELQQLINEGGNQINVKIRAILIPNSWSGAEEEIRMLRFPNRADSFLIPVKLVSSVQPLEEGYKKKSESEIIVQIPWIESEVDSNMPKEYMVIEISLEIPNVKEPMIFFFEYHSIYNEGTAHHTGVPIFVKP